MCGEAAAQDCSDFFTAKLSGGFAAAKEWWRMLWGDSGANTRKAAHADILL